jgi:tetratricopeptide (TPR) repeat protein
VGEHDPGLDPKRFGRYLRKIREDRRLSLDAVEEMSFGFPGRVTKSHLSRIENGLAEPTFPRMFALSQIYGVPIAFLAERFEADLRREMRPAELSEKTIDVALREARELTVAGRYSEALVIYEAIVERATDRDRQLESRLLAINCLIHLGRHGLAKEECEQILSTPELPGPQRIGGLRSFAICCFRLQKYDLALMALEQAERDPTAGALTTSLQAELKAIRGNLLSEVGRCAEAIDAYRAARALYKELKISFEVCRVTINLASTLIELGETNQAKHHLRQALAESEAGGYDRLTALALSNFGLIAFREADPAATESYCIRSNALARPREYLAVVFRNCYYLWRVAVDAGDEAGARSHERALKRYAGRLEETIPELERYRAYLAGDER